MTRTRIGLVVGLAVMALAVAGCGGSNDSTTAATDTTATDTTATDTTATTDTNAATATTLIGSVASDDFTITLTTEDGTNVTTLPAGDYTLEIVDKTDIHNFHLTGSGVDEASEVGGQEDKEVPITLVAGSYHYQCDPHSTQMNGDFEVTG